MEKQIMSNYATEDAAVWKALFERQIETVPGLIEVEEFFKLLLQKKS